MVNISRTGYKRGSKTENNPYNIIPGGKITMRDVDYDVMAIPYKNGKPLKSVRMRPGEEYDFDADFTLELPMMQYAGFVPLGGGATAVSNLYDSLNQTDPKLNLSPKGMMEAGEAHGINDWRNFQRSGAMRASTPMPQYMPPPDEDLINRISQAAGAPLTRKGRMEIKSDNIIRNDRLRAAATDSSSTNMPANTGIGFIPGAGMASNIDLSKLNLNTTDNGITDVGGGKEATDAGGNKEANSNIFFNNLLSTPSLYSGIDTTSALFKLGQSLGFGTESIQTEKGKKRARGANLLRGVASAGKSLAGIGRMIGQGMGYSNMLSNAMKDYNEDQRRRLVTNFRFKDGGVLQHLKHGGTVDDIPTPKMLTGEYLAQLPDKQVDKHANVEVEHGEYVKHLNGDVQYAVGESHKNGGIKVNLDSGTQVLSNHLKVGKSISKYLKDTYGISVKPDSTFANALHKYTKQIGLEKINELQEERFKEVEKQMEVKHRPTAELNLQFLSEKIKNLEDRKRPLLEDRMSAFDDIFDLQESAKPKEEQSSEMQMMQKGGTVSPRFKKLCQKYGISVERGMELMKYGGEKYKYGGKKESYYQEGGELPKMQSRGTFLEPEYNIYRDPALYTHQRFTESPDGVQLSGVVKTDNLSQRLEETLRLFPRAVQFMERDADGNLVFKSKDDVGKFQNYVQSVYKDLGKYASSSEGASDGGGSAVTDLLKQFSFAEGVPAREFDALAGNFTTSRSGFSLPLVPQEELDKLHEKGIYNFSQLFSMEGNLRNDLGISDETMQKVSAIYEEYPNFEVRLRPLTGVVKETLEEDPIMLDTSPPDVLYTGKIVEPPPADDGDLEEIKTPEEKEEVDLSKVRAVASRRSFPILPDQSLPAPEGLRPHLMVDRTYDRLDPARLGVEQQLKEAARSRDFMAGQLEQLPDSQRLATLAQVTANTEENINNAIFQTEAQNAMNRQQADSFNIQQQVREEDMRAADMLDYERRSYTGLGKAQENLARYFDYNRRIGIGNFNTVQRYNLLNNLYENYGIGSAGDIAFVGGLPGIGFRRQP